MDEDHRHRPMAQQVWRLAGRFERLLAYFGIGAAMSRIGCGAALDTALRRCERCSDQTACESWLTRLEMGAEPGTLGPPSDCPNRELIELALAERKAHHRDHE